MVKVVVLVDNKQEDLDMLKRLIEDECKEIGENPLVIPLLCIYDGTSPMEKLVEDAYDKLFETMNSNGVEASDAAIRIAIDLFLRRDDRENADTVDEKTGMKFLKLFSTKYAAIFKSVYLYFMSKINTGGDIIHYASKELNGLPGGMVLLRKPLSYTGNDLKFKQGKSLSYNYTNILTDEQNSRLFTRAFVRALVIGERKY